MYQRGRLYWALLDKRRPVLLLSIDARNERANDLLVIPCSTTLREAPSHVRLARGEGGLARPCMLKCEQITTLPKDDVDPEAIGPRVSAERLIAVERAVLRAIGVPV